MALPAFTAQLTNAVFSTFGETAMLQPAAGGDAVEVRVILRRPMEATPLWDGEVTQTKPHVRIPVVDVALLRKDDVLDGVDGRRWQIAEAPRRPADGRVWMAAVQDAGEAT